MGLARTGWLLVAGSLLVGLTGAVAPVAYAEPPAIAGAHASAIPRVFGPLAVAATRVTLLGPPSVLRGRQILLTGTMARTARGGRW
jgi:hypothetical protein